MKHQSSEMNEHKTNAEDLVHQAETFEKKTAWVSRLLNRSTDKAIRSPLQQNYRHRITLRPNKQGVLGYSTPKTHNHVPIASCSLAHEKINTALSQLSPISFGAKSIELRTNGCRVVANIAPLTGRKPKAKTIESWAKNTLNGCAINGRTVFGDGYLSFDYSKFKHRLGPATFFQVNPEINTLIIDAVTTQIFKWNPTTVLDLFAGAGNLSLPLAAEGISTVLVESDSSATNDAEATIAKHNFPAKTVRKNAYSLQAGDYFFDVLILDPPRAGAKGALSAALVTRPKGVVYLSCNPVSLSKDIKPAIKAGYRVISLQAYDMFPGTNHVETLVFLERN